MSKPKLTSAQKYARDYSRSEKGKSAHRKYHQSKKGRAQAKRYNQTPKRKVWTAKWWRTDKGKAARHRTTSRIKNICFRHYCRGTPKCMCPYHCRVTTVEILELDHIGGGGKEHRKTIGYGTTFYRWLIEHKFPKGYRVLCPNCHRSRHRGVCCPHHKSPRVNS